MPCTNTEGSCPYTSEIDVPNGRIMSSIPKTDSPSPWLYPSPEQLGAAMQKKGYSVTDQSETSRILLIHNVVNEQCWMQISKWEARHCAPESCSLKRFQGRPHDLSPKAWILTKLFGYIAPFDRHDWVVQRPDGKEVRYIIDFYSGKPHPDKPVSLYLDVRPALDSFSALCDRNIMGGLLAMSRRRVKETPPPGTKWHEFVWRHGGRCVILTGNFDNWSACSQHSMHPSQDSGVHKICIALDPSKEWQFKFVVDGVWRCSLDYPTVKDPSGNTNNILHPE